ncbi:hypothetical protein [Butyricimonas paravirosa]|uniref:hypothetical protein n=1 Tax=Butyricimonas paravirosa TaxID=1472417 RepID=UPI003521BA2F
MKKALKIISFVLIINAFVVVGMTGFEPATTRPPEVSGNFFSIFITIRLFVILLNISEISLIYFSLF